MSKHRDTERERVIAAQRGDRRAQEELARAYLPLVYNVAGRALSVQPDVEDVVQETMLQVIRALPGLRQPESIRAWILTIAMQQVGAHQHRAAGTTALDDLPETGTDFEELAILRLQLSDQRRQVAAASRWLDVEDRNVLALWWQETAGHLDRAETAAALETTPAYAAVRVQRMRAQLDRSRSLVAALDARPRCPELVAAAAGWDGRPSPLWRKRLDRHVRDCDLCLSNSREEVAAERLLVGCGLLPVPAALTSAVLGKISATGGTAGGTATAARPRLGSLLRGKPLAATAAAVVVLAGGALAYTAQSEPDRPQPDDRVAAAAAPSPAPVTRSALPSSAAPTPSRTTATATAAKTTRAAVATPTAKGCGAKLTTIWAGWPMRDTAKYTNLGNGTVRDTTTCLVWQRAHAPDRYTFAEAKQYCAGLTLDGGGWRLPSRIELTSIVDYGADNPAINTTTFTGTPPRYFWTSSPWAVTKTPLRAWIINFYEGLASNAAEQSGAFNVRCVRADGGSGRPAYKISSGRVTDPATGLTWQRASSAEMTVAKADAYCTDGWRLPTLKELATTVDETRVSPAIDIKAFPDTPKTARYWSSTVATPRPADRWMLGYNDGVTTYKPYETGRVRCVR
ncbi:RNA polymerase sigma factor (sigma-70 family) [Actinoplanes lutulentus]|uniref:RNA polymerase sigma factor n=1 Tax=Actinoplanes lutulentus TaxID=1287878 RepID=A0A327ZC95_9ACTN|nr:sigma-70 family RNA polymerase sigma factor [Actinoplanes lutulentus]MBB2947300.1 RNA polymerase sigma factor (sigma-70 family) [Actinoplanes lutulentus]RAK36575.1 RNA polymerase sigma factor (sigma-70 family) [Actinoplanes lutulentus]